MDWAYLRSELQRIIVYLVLALAARGGWSLMPGAGVPNYPPASPPTLPIAPPAPPAPVAPGLPIPRIDPEAAVVRIQSGSAGCTATIIGPSPVKGYQMCLSAAHCVSSEGARVRVWHKSGKVYDGRVYKRLYVDGQYDCCLIVLPTDDQLSYARVADACPAEGVRVWHAGWGVDKPGNRETGQVIRSGCDGGFCRLQISVSSGDSGCGFFRADTGELIGTCYGTDGRYAVGPGVVAIRAFLKKAAG